MSMIVSSVISVLSMVNEDQDLTLGDVWIMRLALLR